MTIQVAAAIIYKDGKFLIAKRAHHKHLGGFWEFPGGKIEPGETPENCLLRELDEELKIKVEVIQYLAENTHDYGTLSVVLKAYLCSYLEGEFILTDHDEVKWVRLNELTNYALAPADIPFVKVLENLF